MAVEAKNWSVEAGLRSLDHHAGISKTREKLLKVVGSEKWAELTARRGGYSEWKLEQRGYHTFKDFTFEKLRHFAFPPNYHPPSTLKYHLPSRKYRLRKIYPACNKADASLPFLPFELWRDIFLYCIPEAHLDRLAKIQTYHKRTGTRLIAAFVCKLTKVHPWMVS
jgi:hypothetical protein